MKQAEIDLLTKLFDTKAEDTQRFINTAMEDIRRTIAVASAHTDGRIDDLNKTIKEHNGRLSQVESVIAGHKKIVNALKWAGKHWYITVVGIILIILVLIPIADFLGFKGLISLLK